MPDKRESGVIREIVVLNDKVSRKRPVLERPTLVKVPGRGVPVAERKPAPLLDYKVALQKVRDLGLVLKQNLQPGDSVTLSPKCPFIEGRGHLDFINVSQVYCEGSSAWFQRDERPDDYKKIDLWLKGLTVGSSYLVQIRVSGDPDGHWEVRGSNSTAVSVTGGYEVNIPVLVHDLHYDLSLVTVEARGMDFWGFYDVLITAL